MRYSKQSLGSTLIIIMDDFDDEEIRRTFNSFFHHGAVGKDAKLHWARELDGGGRAYFVVHSKNMQTSKDKAIHAYMMMKTYKFVNMKLKVSALYLDSLLKRLNMTENEYDDYLCELWKPIMYVKAHKWFDSMQPYTMISTASFWVGDLPIRQNHIIDYYDLGMIDDNVYEHEMKSIKEGKHKRTMDRHIRGLQTI
jgi:hypothetical protein